MKQKKGYWENLGNWVTIALHGNGAKNKNKKHMHATLCVKIELGDLRIGGVTPSQASWEIGFYL